MMKGNDFIEMCRPLVTIPFYPREEHDVVMDQLARFVHNGERLRWLVDTAVSGMTKWLGVAALRALYDTRWPPADGKSAGDCSIQGFTPEDSERSYQERQAAETAKQLAAWKREAALLPPAERVANQKLLEGVTAVVKPMEPRLREIANALDSWGGSK